MGERQVGEANGSGAGLPFELKPGRTAPKPHYLAEPLRQSGSQAALRVLSHVPRLLSAADRLFVLSREIRIYSDALFTLLFRSFLNHISDASVLIAPVNASTPAMTDPLSVAAGIAGLISLGIQVTESLAKFYTLYKGQDADVNRTSAKLESLSGTFKFLSSALQSRTFRSDEQGQIKNIESSIRKCDELIQELQEECEKCEKVSKAGTKGTIRTVGRRMVYPFRQSTLQKLDEAISEIGDNLSLALEALQLRDYKHTQDDINELKSLIEIVRATQISSMIRDWLKAPDVTILHNAACAKRHPGTGTWFVKGPLFTTWLTQDNSFLWLNGFAGCGKSVLCSTAIQYIFRYKRSDPGVGIAFFYFTFDDKSKQDELAMLRALLLQLSGQLSDSQTDLARLRDLYSTGIPPAIVLIAHLQHLIQKFDQVYILLDALDESPRYGQRDQVLVAIETMRKWLLPGLHLLVTSRDEADIRESLSPAGNEEVIMKNAEINRDISKFISGQLNVDPKLRRWRAHHDRIQQVLAERAQGEYVIGNCIFINIGRCWLTKDIDFVGLNANSSLSNDVRGVKVTLTGACSHYHELWTRHMSESCAV